MKEIWINLELYIKSYEFSIFRDFFWIFLDLFRFLNDKNELKKGQKTVLFPCGATWMRRGTQGHVVVPHGPTRRLRSVIFIFIFYIVYSI